MFCEAAHSSVTVFHYKKVEICVAAQTISDRLTDRHKRKKQSLTGGGNNPKEGIKPSQAKPNRDTVLSGQITIISCPVKTVKRKKKEVFKYRKFIKHSSVFKFQCITQTFQKIKTPSII